ncbi:MAG TPA: CAP domain-containing protein [Streptosporangiaceae bacterium]|jgi:uncharacterized protein YkwD
MSSHQRRGQDGDQDQDWPAGYYLPAAQDWAAQDWPGAEQPTDERPAVAADRWDYDFDDSEDSGGFRVSAIENGGYRGPSGEATSLADEVGPTSAGIQPAGTQLAGTGRSPSGTAPGPVIPGGPPRRGATPPGPPGGGKPGRPRPRRGLRIMLSLVAVAVVVIGLGAYALYRANQPKSLAARPDSASAACTVAASTGGGAVACDPASPAADGSAAASSGTPSKSPSPKASKHAASHRPKPHPSASTHPASPKPSPAPSSTAPATSTASAIAQVMSLINKARAQAGLPAYTLLSGLDTSSQRHTQTMEDGCGLSHQCPGEAPLGLRITEAGVLWTSAGENIGEGGPVADTKSAIASMAAQLTQDMLNEKPPNDGHRENILSSSFTHIGICVLRDARGTVWMTQDFAN